MQDGTAVTHSTLSQKIPSIRDTLPAAVIHVLSNVVRNSVRENSSEHLKAPAILTKLETDLLYIVARHRRFTSLQILEDLMADFVATGYRVERNVSEAIAKSVTQATRRLIPEELRPIKDQRVFLRHVFLSAATARDEAHLVADLGLGEGLLRRLRAGAEVVMQSNSDETCRFVPDIDACFAEIMVEMSRNLRADPLALEIARINEILEESKVVSLEVAPHDLFKLIMQIGRIGKARDDIIAREMGLSGLSPQICTPQKINDILGKIVSADLAFVVERLHRINREIVVWSLTSRAETLTANAFAGQWNWTTESLNHLFRLCPAWQAAVVTQWPQQKSSELAHYLSESATAFSRQGLDAALARASKILPDDSLGEICCRLLDPRTIPWVRQAAIAVAGRLLGQDRVLRELERIAKTDPSSKFRHQAVEQFALQSSNVHESRLENMVAATMLAP
jgi:hypothetical protein